MKFPKKLLHSVPLGKRDDFKICCCPIEFTFWYISKGDAIRWITLSSRPERPLSSIVFEENRKQAL